MTDDLRHAKLSHQVTAQAMSTRGCRQGRQVMWPYAAAEGWQGSDAKHR